MSKSPSGRVQKVSLPQKKQRATSPLPKADEESARLLADADAFLRLGLVEKAVEHLSDAVRRDPSLRLLREPLMKLYVTQGANKQAVAELWALLRTCKDPREEIRWLRYILRLGEKSPAAEKRLHTLLSQQQSEPLKMSMDVAAPSSPVSEVGGTLRSYVGQNRPPTDLARTMDIPESESKRYLHESEPPDSAVTRPSTDEIEAVAEEIAWSSGDLTAALREVDSCIARQRYSEGLGRLRVLAVRFPHSKRVRARLQELECQHGEKESSSDQVAPLPASRTSTRRRPSLPAHALKNTLSRKQTIEVEPTDIKEERALPTRKRVPPPPPPSGELKLPTQSDAARAFRTGSTMRSFGQLERAIGMFEQAIGDPTHGAVAALMAGICYRDLKRFEQAVDSFKRGINLPDVSDATLSELFYELGDTYELVGELREAILHYQLSLGTAGSYRDAAERITALQESLNST